MARILIGWEFGGGHNHAVNMVAVGRMLAARGHEVFFAVRDVVAAWPVFREAGFPMFALPMSQSIPWNAKQPFLARSFADILCLQSFHVPDVLEARTRLCHSLLQQLQPDVVLAEFAPILCFAARGRVPCLSFGTAFSVPCLENGAFPVLVPHAKSLGEPQLLAQAVQTVSQRFQQESPRVALEAFVGLGQAALCFDVIDPYRRIRSPAGLGPLWAMPREIPRLPQAQACLIYLPADHPMLGAMLQGLQGLSLPGVVYIRGANPSIVQQVRELGLEVVTTPINLDEILPHISVVFHHGGAGTTQRCLAYGRPQVLAPMVLEQSLTTGALLREGVVLALGGPVPFQNSGALINQVAGDEAIRQRAQFLAQRLLGQYASGSQEALLQHCQVVTGVAL